MLVDGKATVPNELDATEANLVRASNIVSVSLVLILGLVRARHSYS